MRLGAVLFAAGLAAAALTVWADDAPPVRFAAVFRDTTMRVDYFHTGDAGHETFALDRIVSDGRWAGSRTILLDSLNLGTWRFTVLDSATGEALYSRGYSSLYAEWETTNPRSAATFHESLRFLAEGTGARRARTADWQNAWVEADLRPQPEEPGR
jgi:hypothetical protein